MLTDAFVYYQLNIMNRRFYFVCICISLSALTLAAEIPFKPFADAPITLEQWTTYHAQVRDALRSSVQERAAEMSVMYFDESTRTQYIFTLPNHPAHPAWIARRLVTRSGATTIEQVGYFAGSQEQFAAWFEAYQRSNEQMKQQR
jgi:hypothetical protein